MGDFLGLRETLQPFAGMAKAQELVTLAAVVQALNLSTNPEHRGTVLQLLVQLNHRARVELLGALPEKEIK